MLKVFKVGTVVEYADDGRAILIDETPGIFGGPGVFRARNVDTVEEYVVSEQFLQDHAFPTAVQPGQIYDGKVYQYKVLAAVTRDKWECEIVGTGRKYRFPETEIHFHFTLVGGLDAIPVHSHGPHRCPRCLRMGAQILARTVECVNPKCPCYVPLKG